MSNTLPLAKPFPTAHDDPMTSNATRHTLPSNYSPSISSDVKTQSAPFRAALHAFSQTSSKDRASTTRDVNAIAAVTAASTATLGKEKEKDTKSPDGAYLKPQPGKFSLDEAEVSEASSTLGTTYPPARSREQSPSHVAALLATKPRVTPTQEISARTTYRSSSRRPSPLHSVEDLSLTQPTDVKPIGDANTLIKLFESNQTQTPAPIVHSVRYTNKVTLPTKRMEPVKSVSRSVSSTPLSLRPIPNPPVRVRGNTTSSIKGTSVAAATKPAAVKPRESTRESKTSTRTREVSAQIVPDFPSPGRIEDILPLDGPQDIHRSTVATIRVSQKSEFSAGDPTEEFLDTVTAGLRSRPSRSPARPALPKRYTEPADLPLTRSMTINSQPALTSQQSSRETVDPVRPVRKSMRSSDSYIPQLTVDSLANAMVASSLASSRAPSPSKPPPLPPPRRHGKHSFIHHRHGQEESRTPSPAKVLRQTMREPLKSEDEDDSRKHRSHRMRKHPNKHHEGDRKRYRNQVTERERKRYEGVWAANRGILLDADASNAVANIVVRDIWKRSRLPDDVLEEIWDLVDNQGVSRLERDEFVVGMFLIDQRLRGNKLPFKVSDSIWFSVRNLSGVNLPRGRP